MNVKSLNGSNQRLYHMYTCILFGLMSGPKLFDKYAVGLEHIMLMNGVKNVCHYIDNSLTVAKDK